MLTTATTATTTTATTTNANTSFPHTPLISPAVATTRTLSQGSERSSSNSKKKRSSLSSIFSHTIPNLLSRLLNLPLKLFHALRHAKKTTYLRFGVILVLVLIIIAIVGIFRRELIFGGWGCADAREYALDFRNGSFVVHGAEKMVEQSGGHSSSIAGVWGKRRSLDVGDPPPIAEVRLTDTLVFFNAFQEYNVTQVHTHNDLRPIPEGFDSRALHANQLSVELNPDQYSQYLTDTDDHQTPKGYIYFAWIEANVTSSVLLRERDCKQSLLLWLLETLRSIPLYLSAPIFIIVYSIACVLFVPGLILTLAAGFLFKWWGLPVVSCGSVLGATLAFLMGRTLARNLVASAIQKYPRFRAIDRAIEKEGWKIILLLRLIPLIPFNLMNYALGLTSARLFDYIWASFVGMMPGTALFVYFGISAGSVADIVAGRVGTGGIYTQLISLAVSGVFIVVTFFVILFIAKRAMKKYMADDEEDEYGTDSYLEGLEHSSAEDEE